MRQLADEVILSKSGVTRLIDRLVDDGLVERSACLTDARGAEAVLTERGLARLRSASRTHLRGVDEHFLAVLEPADLHAIERAMAALAGHAGAGQVADPGRCVGDGGDAGPYGGPRGSGGC
jgi:DNA-binding MarR family transcriptional regulator